MSFRELRYSVFTLLHFFHRVKVKLMLKFITYATGVFTFGVTGISIFELDTNPAFTHLGDVAYYVISTMSTVGFGDKTTITSGGRIITVMMILMSLGLIALFSALMAALFIETKLREEMGMNPIKTKNHILIVGWNMKGRKIIERLHSDPHHKGTEVVIIANLESKPVDDDAVFFVRYKSLLDSHMLHKASAEHAQKIIILADYEQKFGADAFTTTHCMLARRINPKAQIVVEMLNIHAREYFEIAGADDIIGVGELGGLMITEACFGENSEILATLDKLKGISKN
ncbi:MAG TPA: NAD-binding protein [Marinagarivorans sp.]